jgi:hypothetical protein
MERVDELVEIVDDTTPEMDRNCPVFFLSQCHENNYKIE